MKVRNTGILAGRGIMDTLDFLDKKLLDQDSDSVSLSESSDEDDDEGDVACCTGPGSIQLQRPGGVEWQSGSTTKRPSGLL